MAIRAPDGANKQAHQEIIMVMMKGRPGDQETKDKECNKDVKITAGLGENGSAGCCVKQTGK